MNRSKMGPHRLVLLIGALALAGCDGILDVELPTQVGAEVVDDPALAPQLRASLIGDFECAFANYVPATGMIAGELRHSTTIRVRFLWSQRRVTGEEPDQESCTGGGFGVFRPLQTARFQAETFLDGLAGWGPSEVPDHADHVAVASVYAAYSLTLLAEGYCELALDAGPLLTPEEVLARAETRFTEALAAAESAGNDEIRHLSLVGRARARLNLGRHQEAVQDAERVAEGFTYFATYSSADARRRNKIYEMNRNSNFISVNEPYTELEWQGVPDPRVQSEFSPSPGHAGGPVWWQTKYTAPGSPIRLASWEEAQLVIAEVRGGQTAVEIINRFHDEAGLPPFTSTDPDEIREHVVQERERVLFLEGHRLNDMLRHGLPFQEGVGPDGVNYGTTTCIPLPRREREGNPNIPLG